MQEGTTMRGSARSSHAEVELLVDELMRVKGWGADPRRLAHAFVMRKLAKVDPGLYGVTAGCIVERYLVESIKTLPDRKYLFQGQKYPVQTIQEALSWELGVNDSTGAHPARICRVMLLLERWDSYDQWRKHPRLERGFLTILAEHMVNQTTKP